MESTWETGESIDLSLIAGLDGISSPTPETGYFSLDQFAAAVGAELAPDGIGLRVEETRDGTRLLKVWLLEMPAWQNTIPIDSIRLCAEQVQEMAALARRTVERSRPALSRS